MSRTARVVVAYATVRVLDSATGKPTVIGFYRDALLPAAADPDSVAVLVRRGYAEWVDAAPSAEPNPPAADKAEPAKAPTKAAAPAAARGSDSGA